MVCSGFAGLGYQIVWTQQGALWLGSEGASLLAVVAAFFGGLALGAMALGARIERSTRPGRWYAACEIAIAAWGVVLAWLMPAAASMLQPLIGDQPTPLWQWAVAFVATFLLLLPATAAMGATLPAMERVLATRRERSAIAWLYAGNTAGAVVGVLATAFWLAPTLGLVRTAAVCVAMNLLCAAIAWRALDGESAPPAMAASRRVPWTLVATGLLGIGYEVLVVRVVSQVAENTVYTFAILLAVYLVGTTLGAAAWQRWMKNDPRLRDRLLLATAGACLMGTMALGEAEAAKAWLLAIGPGGYAGALLAEAGVCVLAFGLPTIAMGALFSQLATQAQAAGIAFGRALGFNTLGAAAGPLLFGVLAVPAFGPKAALLAVASGYVLLVSTSSWRRPVAGVVVGAVLALAVWAPPLAFVDVPEGGRIVSYLEGPTAAVSVVQDDGGVSRLRIDNRQQEGSSASRFADGRQALLPLLLHPAPKRALFLGLGTGVTSSTAAADRSLQVDAVELLPEVIEASALFAGRGEPRPRTLAADARRYVRATDARYDVVVSDNFHPARSGSGSLYTVEHFEAVRARLAPGGLFCQWLPLHQLDLPTLRSIVRAYLAAFPDGAMLLATNSLETPTLGLIGHADAGRFDLRAVQSRLSTPGWPLADYGLADRFAIAGSFVAGPAELARFAGDAPLNTDDHPVVAYLAPRITYAPDSAPRDRLSSLLAELGRPTSLKMEGDANDTSRLAAYWQARNQFIEAGRQVRPSSDVRAMLAQVHDPLLAVLRTSPDFTPAFEPLARMAKALTASDVAAGRALEEELDQVRRER